MAEAGLDGRNDIYRKDRRRISELFNSVMPFHGLLSRYPVGQRIPANPTVRPLPSECEWPYGTISDFQKSEMVETCLGEKARRMIPNFQKSGMLLAANWRAARMSMADF